MDGPISEAIVSINYGQVENQTGFLFNDNDRLWINEENQFQFNFLCSKFATK